MGHYIVSGIIKKITGKKNLIGLKDFSTLIREILLDLRVANVDSCCPTQDITKLPVVFNKTTGQLQYFDSATNTYVNVP